MQVCAFNNNTSRSLKGLCQLLLSFLEMGFGEGKEMCKEELIVADGNVWDVCWQQCV